MDVAEISPSAMLDSLVTALLSVPATVVPSGFTRRACGFVTGFGASAVPASTAVFTVPSAFTSSTL